jgi:hypothetical protein
LIETAKEEEFDFVAEQIKTDYFSDNELLSVIYNEKSIIINYHTSIYLLNFGK